MKHSTPVHVLISIHTIALGGSAACFGTQICIKKRLGTVVRVAIGTRVYEKYKPLTRGGQPKAQLVDDTIQAAVAAAAAAAAE